MSDVSEDLTRVEKALGVCRSSASEIEDAIQHCVQSQFWPEAGETVVAVYGNDVQAYSMVQGLLAHGIQPNKIALIPPPAEVAGSPFQNSLVDEKVFPVCVGDTRLLV